MNPLILFVRFVALLLIQVLILDELLLHGFLTPYLYLLIVLWLPLTFPTWGALLIGFAMGLAVDFFLNTGGMHALATTFIAYVRPVIIRLLSPPEGYETDDQPTLKSMGFGWFFIYALSVITIHHLVYFSIEILSFSYLLYFLKKLLLTALATLVLVFFVQILMFTRRA